MKREAHDSAIIDNFKKINLAANNKFFLWHIWFGNVFNREKNGCDCITNHNIKYADAYYIESNDIRTSDGVFVLESKNSYHKGKRKGETLELYQKPLSEIPIRCASQDIQKLNY